MQQYFTAPEMRRNHGLLGYPMPVDYSQMILQHQQQHGGYRPDQMYEGGQDLRVDHANAYFAPLFVNGLRHVADRDLIVAWDDNVDKWNELICIRSDIYKWYLGLQKTHREAGLRQFLQAERRRMDNNFSTAADTIFTFRDLLKQLSLRLFPSINFYFIHNFGGVHTELQYKPVLYINRQLNDADYHFLQQQLSVSTAQSAEYWKRLQSFFDAVPTMRGCHQAAVHYAPLYNLWKAEAVRRIDLLIKLYLSLNVMFMKFDNPVFGTASGSSASETARHMKRDLMFHRHAFFHEDISEEEETDLDDDDEHAPIAQRDEVAQLRIQEDPANGVEEAADFDEDQKLYAEEARKFKDDSNFVVGWLIRMKRIIELPHVTTGDMRLNQTAGLRRQRDVEEYDV